MSITKATVIFRVSSDVYPWLYSSPNHHQQQYQQRGSPAPLPNQGKKTTPKTKANKQNPPNQPTTQPNPHVCTSAIVQCYGKFKYSTQHLQLTALSIAHSCFYQYNVPAFIHRLMDRQTACLNEFLHLTSKICVSVSGQHTIFDSQAYMKQLNESSKQ